MTTLFDIRFCDIPTAANPTASLSLPVNQLFQLANDPCLYVNNGVNAPVSDDIAQYLNTTGAPVNVSASLAPSAAGYTLTATSATTATWQLFSGGGNLTNTTIPSVAGGIPRFTDTTGLLVNETPSVIIGGAGLDEISNLTSINCTVASSASDVNCCKIGCDSVESGYCGRLIDMGTRNSVCYFAVGGSHMASQSIICSGDATASMYLSGVIASHSVVMYAGNSYDFRANSIIASGDSSAMTFSGGPSQTNVILSTGSNSFLSSLNGQTEKMTSIISSDGCNITSSVYQISNTSIISSHNARINSSSGGGAMGDSIIVAGSGAVINGSSNCSIIGGTTNLNNYDIINNDSFNSAIIQSYYASISGGSQVTIVGGNYNYTDNSNNITMFSSTYSGTAFGFRNATLPLVASNSNPSSILTQTGTIASPLTTSTVTSLNIIGGVLWVATGQTITLPTAVNLADTLGLDTSFFVTSPTQSMIFECSFLGITDASTFTIVPGAGMSIRNGASANFSVTGGITIKFIVTSATVTVCYKV